MPVEQTEDDAQNGCPEANSQAGGIIKGQTYTMTLKIPVDVDPRNTSAQFSNMGIGWLLKTRYLLGLSSSPEEGKIQLETVLDAANKEADDILESSSLFKGLDLHDEADCMKAVEIIGQNQDTLEWWAYHTLMRSGEAKEALDGNDIRLGMWAVSLMHAARAMMIYKQSIERITCLGYATAELRSVLKTWQDNKEQTDEGFWQKTFAQNALIFSQLFSFPVVFLEGQAYLGGKGIENTGGKLVDFLVSNQLSQNTALIEIKTPKTPLLAKQSYRARVFPVSEELSGAVNQALAYKHTLGEEYLSVRNNSTQEFHAFNPQCLVVAGSYNDELKTKDQKRSFELFRATLKDVQVITYDEVFAKFEALLNHLGA